MGLQQQAEGRRGQLEQQGVESRDLARGFEAMAVLVQHLAQRVGHVRGSLSI